MKRRKRGGVSRLTEEYNENKKQVLAAVLLKNARVIPVDVRGIIETMGKPCKVHFGLRRARRRHREHCL